MEEKFDGVIGIVFHRSNPIKYLLIHNKKTENISFPSGGREDGETKSIETLRREIKEETGLEFSEYRATLIPLTHEFVYNSKKKERAGQKAIQKIYLVETNKTYLKSEDPDAKLEGWFNSEEVLNKLTFSDSKDLFKIIIGEYFK